MISLVCIWSLVILCGVSAESPTYPPSNHEPHPSQSEETSTFSTEFDNLNYTSSPNPDHGDEEWKPYSPDIYPLFKKAVQELASSERGFLILWDSLISPEPPKTFFDRIFRAYNSLVEDVPSSSTTGESNEATMLTLTSTESEVPELVSGVYDSEERAAETEHSDAIYHTSISTDGDEIDVYYSTENPDAEVVVLDEELYYASSVDPEPRISKAFNLRDMFRDASAEAEVTSETVESEVSASESVEDIVRRSGILVDDPTSIEDDVASVPLRVGSIRGIPCEDFPCYDEIPITSFSCADKRIPGIYADLETGCQVFHVCWSNRRESFLCPIGTTFNQPITSCDYWYSSNCSLSTLYFESTTEPQFESTTPGCKETTSTPQTTEPSPTERDSTEKPDHHPLLEEDWFHASKFVPIKTKVTVYFKPEGHSKQPSPKKPLSKQKHDILPLIEDFLELTKTVAKDAVKLVPKVIEPEITKHKVFKKPAAKLVPCLEIKDHHKPTPSVVMDPKPLPTLNPRFIVKPVDVKKPLVKIHYEKKNKFVSPKEHVKLFHPLSGHKTNVQPVKDHASEIVLKALEMVGDVFQRDILALTRQALAEDYKHEN